MVRSIWKELIKVRVEVETIYGSENLSEMVRQYLWGTLHAHWLMDEFLEFFQKQLRQHLEVALHITLYLFEHGSPWFKVSDLKQRVQL